MNYIGLMSGTSMDGVDAVLVRFDNKKTELLGSLYSPYPPALKNEITRLIVSEPSLPQVARADHQLGQVFADCVNKLLKKFSVDKKDCQAIGSHGQTIFHQPEKKNSTSIQIGDPNIIVEQTGITTVADFRRRDMAAGGQGAPLAPGFHEFFFREQGNDRVVLNLGGIANITILPGNPDTETTGYDCGPGNTLLDSWSKNERNNDFDKNGEWAASGTINEALLANLMTDSYFSQKPPKSTGREYFNLEWLDNTLKHHPELNTADVQATLVELTAKSCAQEILAKAPATREVLVCGGGVHNTYLMSRLTELISVALPDCKVNTTSGYGIDPDWVEAIAFAWMAKQTLEKVPSNLPGVTGAHHPVILGGIYPAR